MINKKELVFERIGTTVRLAVLENGRLCEYFCARGGVGALAGNIYTGRVQNVLPGMNAAFVDIGLQKNAFLPADGIPSGETEKRIEKLVRPGQLITCQVSKEPGGSKGPRISCDISLPGRLCAIVPNMNYRGVSKKIDDRELRDQLHAVAKELTDETGIGIIVRTAAENETIRALREDYYRMVETWEKIRVRAQVSTGPELLYTDSDLLFYAMRELSDDSVDSVRTDDAALAEEIKVAAKALAPHIVDRVELWTGDIPLFDLLRVDRQLENALARRVNLKSGGSLIFDETEAMAVIDVNTGRFTGKKDIDTTIEKTNAEAAEEIAIQIRLRDLGGIIVIDFIDMATAEDREALLKKMKELMAGDRNHAAVIEMTSLGLMELTRKKVRRPLSKRMAVTCGACRGEGIVLSDPEIALRCAREIRRRRRGGDSTVYEIRACAEMIERIREDVPAEDRAIVYTAVPNARNYEILPMAAEK